MPIDIELLSILFSASEKTQKPILIEAIKYYQNELDINEIFKYIILNKNTTLLYNLNQIDIKLNTISQISYSLEYGTPQLVYNDGELCKSDNFQRLSEYWDNFIKEDLTAEWENIKDNKTSYQKFILYLMYVISHQSNQDFVIHLLNRVISMRDLIEKYIEFGETENIFEFNEEIIMYNLSNVEGILKSAIPTILTKTLYREMEQDLGGGKFLKLVIDEAHNLLKENNIDSYIYEDYRIKMFEKIIKEGRKFNTFLYLSSQRPSEISETIISQLHNYFIHNLKNYKDVNIMKNSVSYISENKFETLNSLSKGVLIYGGLASEMNDVIKIDNIINENNIPKSNNIEII